MNLFNLFVAGEKYDPSKIDWSSVIEACRVIIKHGESYQLALCHGYEDGGVGGDYYPAAADNLPPQLQSSKQATVNGTARLSLNQA